MSPSPSLRTHPFGRLGDRGRIVDAISMIICLFLTVSCLSTRVDDEKGSELDRLTLDRLRIIRLNLDSGKPRQAWAELQNLVREYPENSKILNMAGLNFLAMSEPKQALTYFRKAYKITPTIAIGLNISSALICIGEYNAATRVVKRLLKKNESYAYPERLWHNLALIQEKDNKIDTAIGYYQKAIALNPNYYLSLLGLARIYKTKKLPDKSLSYYAQASQVCESCFEPVNEIATDLINQGKSREAVLLLEKFLAKQKEEEIDQQPAKDLLGLAKRISQRQAKK